jgi:transcriptional regulator with GAF, ATPase, and Fis domain
MPGGLVSRPGMGTVAGTEEYCLRGMSSLPSHVAGHRGAMNAERALMGPFREQVPAMAEEHANDDVAASIAELQNLLLATRDIEDFLQELAVLAARRVTGGLSCGITMQPNGRPLTVASSDIIAEQMDEVQYGIDEGPCLQSMRSGQVVRIEDTSGEDRWAGFTMRAAANGIRSTLSLPLTAEGKHMGALNLYAPVSAAFGTAETQRAESFAATATGALTLAVRQAATADLTSQLRAALAARAVIDQAIGVIMAQERCTQAEAFAIMRTASQNRNVKLRTIATQVVTSVTGQPPQPPAPFDED